MNQAYVDTVRLLLAIAPSVLARALPSLRAQRGNPGVMDRHGLRPRDDGLEWRIFVWRVGVVQETVLR